MAAKKVITTPIVTIAEPEITLEPIVELTSEQLEIKALKEQLATLETEKKAVEEKAKQAEHKIKTLGNTQLENELLGQEAKSTKKEVQKEFNPFDEKILYKVYNSEANSTTIMCGDEVEFILGSQISLIKKVKGGLKEFEKDHYSIKKMD